MIWLWSERLATPSLEVFELSWVASLAYSSGMEATQDKFDSFQMKKFLQKSWANSWKYFGDLSTNKLRAAPNITIIVFIINNYANGCDGVCRHEFVGGYFSKILWGFSSRILLELLKLIKLLSFL